MSPTQPMAARESRLWRITCALANTLANIGATRASGVGAKYCVVSTAMYATAMSPAATAVSAAVE
jgi:hypothetical protein